MSFIASRNFDIKISIENFMQGSNMETRNKHNTLPNNTKLILMTKKNFIQKMINQYCHASLLQITKIGIIILKQIMRIFLNCAFEFKIKFNLSTNHMQKMNDTF